LTGPVQLDDETRNALILFNARLVAQDELEKEKRRVDKAAKAKDEAAAKVRELENNPKATAEQKSEAQAAYLASLDTLNRAKAGEPIAEDTSAPAESADTDDEQAETAEAEVEIEVDESADEPETESAPEAVEDTADEPETESAPEAVEDTVDEAEPESAPEAVEPAATDEPAETDEPAAT